MEILRTIMGEYPVGIKVRNAEKSEEKYNICGGGPLNSLHALSMNPFVIFSNFERIEGESLCNLLKLRED
jgi:hypothetical protein